MFHEGAGELIYASALAPYIDINIPLYGLPANPIDAAPMQTVQRMATRMVQMKRAVQPVGPYRVAGWSFGGLLAYDIVTQLIAEHQGVSFLGVFDTRYPVGAREVSSHFEEFNDKNYFIIYIRRLSINSVAASNACRNQVKCKSNELCGFHQSGPCRFPLDILLTYRPPKSDGT